MFANPGLRPLIIVFAKAPIPGAVKTRLQLDPEQAARVQITLVEQLWPAVSQLQGVADAELHTDQPTPAWPHITARDLQTTGDLGQRLSYAIRNGLLQGRPKVLVLGGDTPELPVEHLATLLNADADVAFGPTTDGGYYAITCRKHHPAMFANVHWSTETALTDTVAACVSCSLTVAVGPAWFDLDTRDDIARLSHSFRRTLGL